MTGKADYQRGSIYQLAVNGKLGATSLLDGAAPGWQRASRDLNKHKKHRW